MIHLEKTDSGEKSTLQILLPIFTLIISILYLVFVIYSFVVKDYNGVFWRYLLIPGLSVMMLLQGFNLFLKKEDSNKSAMWLFFGLGAVILLAFFVTLFI